MIDTIQKDAADKMQHAVDFVREDMATIRTGRAHPAMFNKINAEYYGAPTPLQQLASFTVPEARVLMISPFDKSSLHSIERALRDSDFGGNPSNDGNIIRIVLPELTQERRKEYIKVAHRKGEDAKVAIRNVRRHAMQDLDKLIKDGEVGEDDGKRGEKDLDATTKKFVEQVDEMMKHKEAELLEV